MLDCSRTQLSRTPSLSHIDPRLGPNALQKPQGTQVEQLRATAINTDRPAGPRLAQGSPGSTTERASLDVDAFKRLIVSNEKGSTVSGTPQTPPVQAVLHQGLMGDSSSTTDTSSISRQSMFEPVPETAPETPRTSHEISLSEDERQGFEGAYPRQPVKTPLGNPATAHVLPTLSLNSPSRGVINSDSGSGITRSSSKRLKDLNKPLPPPPASAQPQHPGKVERPCPNFEELAEESGPISPSARSERKRPPTPPLSRRHSQLRAVKRPISRSNSARLPPRAEHSSASTSQHGDERTPPPPPMRRAIAERAQSSSDILPWPLTSAAAGPDMMGPTTIATSNSKPPPPPPARTPSVSSVKRHHRMSLAKVSDGGSRPPLPPRNRASSHSSLETTSATRFPTLNKDSSDTVFAQTGESGGERNLHPAGLELLEESASASASNATDILADLSALQREVDELREKYEMR